MQRRNQLVQKAFPRLADTFPHPDIWKLDWEESGFVMAGFSEKRKKNLFFAMS
jgi:hypothetical protein